MTTKPSKATGQKIDALMRENLRELKTELDITRAAFRDDLFEWAATALAGYLDGTFGSLEAAFKAAKGRPLQIYTRSDDTAREIARARRAGEKWETIRRSTA
jgi:hypothetical protein